MSETGADDDDKKTIASSTKATASTRSTVTVGEFAEGDFIDERELKGALQLAVLKSTDAVLSNVGSRNGMDMEIDEEVVSRVAALVWDTVSEDWSEDLARFSSHANRQKVNLDDVSLLCRRNPELFQSACKLAGINAPEAGQKKKGRKRKKEEISALDHLQTPQADSKKQKSSVSTPFITSTPKIPEKSFKKIRFPEEITPIRPGTLDEEDDDIIIDDPPNYQLSVIQEQSREDIMDSFDFGVPGTSLTVNNMTSLVRQAENHQEEENARLEQMIPEEEEYENVDDDSVEAFFGSQKSPKSNKNNSSNKSIDPFATPGNSPAETASTAKKDEEKKKTSGVFSTKVSAFGFDSDDSFDEPVKIIPQPAKKVENLQKTGSNPTSTTTPKSSKNTPKSLNSTKNSSKVQEEKNKSKNRSLAGKSREDSFEEFDFDI